MLVTLSILKGKGRNIAMKLYTLGYIVNLRLALHTYQNHIFSLNLRIWDNKETPKGEGEKTWRNWHDQKGGQDV